jgi:hypothetical protein
VKPTESASGVLAAVLGEVVGALAFRDLGGVPWVEADGQDVEVLTGGPVQLLEAGEQRVELQAAEGLAGVVVEGEQGRAAAVQQPIQGLLVAVVVHQDDRRIHPLSQVLDDGDAFELGRGGLDRLGRRSEQRGPEQGHSGVHRVSQSARSSTS